MFELQVYLSLTLCVAMRATSIIQTSPFASQKSVAESQFKKQAARTLRTTGKSVVASVDRSHARSGAFTKELSKGR